MTVHRIERDNRAVRNAEFCQQRQGIWDFVGLLSYIDMSEHQGCIGGERAQHLRGGTVMEIVKAAAQRLAIQRDAALSRHRARSLHQGGVAAESRFHGDRIEPLEDIADRCVRRRPAPTQSERRVQPVAMDMDEGLDTAVGIGDVPRDVETFLAALPPLSR